MMVRLPLPVTERLAAEALTRGLSLSDIAGELIIDGLERCGEVGWPR